MKSKIAGQYYHDYDNKTGTWCVFHTDKDNHAFASDIDEKQAKHKAEEMNRNSKGK